MDVSRYVLEQEFERLWGVAAWLLEGLQGASAAAGTGARYLGRLASPGAGGGPGGGC